MSESETPERLTPEELAYHRRANMLIERATAVWQHWSAYLTESRRLSQWDAIDEEGRICRGTPPEVPKEDKTG